MYHMYHNKIAIPPELSYIWSEWNTLGGTIHCNPDNITSWSNLTPMRWNILIIQQTSTQKPTVGLPRHDISKKLDPVFR